MKQLIILLLFVITTSCSIQLTAIETDDMYPRYNQRYNYNRVITYPYTSYHYSYYHPYTPYFRQIETPVVIRKYYIQSPPPRVNVERRQNRSTPTQRQTTPIRSKSRRGN